MYHCHIQLYLVGAQPQIFEPIKSMPPLEHFTHTFSHSSQPEPEAAAAADVILADLRELDPEQALEILAANKREETQLIILAGQEQTPRLYGRLDAITDLWPASAPEEELRFRFLRWQQTRRRDMEHWQTRHYLDSTINSVPNLIWYKDKNGVHEKVNDSFCKTVNKTKEQVEGQRHAYIWDVEQDDPACIESERIVMETEQTCVSEETIQTGEGTRLLTTYKSPLYNIDGSVMGTVGVAIDVTRERAYQQELIRKTNSLERLFTTMDCGVIYHSVDGTRIRSINQAALRILGYESQEELMQDGFQMVAPSVVDADKERLRQAIQSLTNVDDSASVEYRVRHKDGRLIHVMGNIKLTNEENALYYQRFLLDCTAQKMQEYQERTENERRQMELVQALSIDYNLVCVFDLDNGMGRALRISDCKLGVLDSVFAGELAMDDCMERYIQECVHPDDKDMMRQVCVRERLKEELQANHLFYTSYRTLCDGETRYFQMKAVYIGPQTGGCGIVLGLRSVDQETRSELEKKALLEDALTQANRASKAKSVFLSNMSHDIRTPMNAIVGFTALAITHIDQRELVEDYLKKIMTSGNHLLSLINDILDMSRIESGKMRLEEKLCSLPDILHSLRNIVQADIHAKQLELYIDAVDVLDESIYCDRLRLNQVLLNLLSNAIKYTPAGGLVTMRIEERPGAPAGFAHYNFLIKDTGIGMSPEFVAHIFEPFERERSSTTSGIQGTGLGMAITKNIVDMMNGSIEVKSEQSVGTEVAVSFTFQISSEEKAPQAIPELKNCRALVVDDDFNTCDSVSYMLQQIGMRAEWTLSGKEAVLRTHQAVMRNDTYCVYIIDWLLPDMNGVEVARRIRKEMGEDVPIIVLTAYDWSDIEEEAREAGITAFCSKPLFLSELRSCLCSVVSASSDHSEETHDEERRAAHRTGHILLAEDNELNQEIAVAVLEEAGFSPEVADNGQIAVEMLSNSEPGYYRIVLMDVQMPVMDGYEATKAIRKLENKKLASIPILAMTANAFEEDKQQALKCGMNGHIAKPINIEKLLDTLDQILS